MSRYLQGAALIFASAFGFGLMPIFALYAYRCGVNVPTLLFFRFGIAALILSLYIKLNGLEWRMPRRELIGVAFLGMVLYTLQSTLYFSAVQYIPASLAALILYVYPVLVAFLAVLTEHEPLSWQTMAPTLISLLGVALVLGTPLEKPDLFGLLLAFGAAVVYSVYIILGRRISAHVPPLLASATISAFAALSFLIYGGSTGTLQFALPGDAWLVVLGVVLFSTILAMGAFFAGIDRIGSTRASILSTIEPVITIAFSVALFQEKMSWLQGIGALLILTGTILVIGGRGKQRT